MLTDFQGTARPIIPTSCWTCSCPSVSSDLPITESWLTRKVMMIFLSLTTMEPSRNPWRRRIFTEQVSASPKRQMPQMPPERLIANNMPSQGYSLLQIKPCSQKPHHLHQALQIICSHSWPIVLQPASDLSHLSGARLFSM
jgi:hypothetical protein